MSKKVKRGEIWLVNWSPGRGSEQQGLRPAVIIQTDAANLNPNYPNAIVVAMSTKGKSVPFHVVVAPSSVNGLNKISYIKSEQVLTVSKERLVKQIGMLEEKYMSQVEGAIKLVLDLN
jgi:mRNA interferase MazF